MSVLVKSIQTVCSAPDRVIIKDILTICQPFSKLYEILFTLGELKSHLTWGHENHLVCFLLEIHTLLISFRMSLTTLILRNRSLMF